MDSKNIVIRNLHKNDIASVNELHNRLHHDDRDESKFLWEFFNAPAGDAIYIVAEDADNGKIVGTQAAIPIILKGSGSEQYLTAKSEDTLVDPAYRGMQIFERMYEMLFAQCRKHGIRYIWGFTSAKKPFQKIGFGLPFSHSQSLIVLKSEPAYNYLVQLNPKNTVAEKLKIRSLTSLSRLKGIIRYFKKACSDEYIIQMEDKVTADLSSILGPLLNDFPGAFIIDETKDYINWRINNNPYHSVIRSVSVFKDDKLVANLIFNKHTADVWYLIQSLYAVQLNEPEKIKITQLALNKFILSDKPVLIRSWNFETNPVNSSETNILKRSGFVHLSRGVFFVWKDITEGKELAPENFILSRLASQGTI